MSIVSCQALVTRLPYAARYNPKPILEMAKRVDPRGLICISMPIHVEHPNNGGRLMAELEDAGLTIICNAAWQRDRHIVTTKSRRLTNCWEPIAILSRSKNYHINREGATKIKKGFEGREGTFDEENFVTCIGDSWFIRNDRRDRRYLPAGVVLNCCQLADLQPKDRVLDPYGNPGVRDTCKLHNWEYVDGDLPNLARGAKKVASDEDEDLLRDGEDQEENSESDSGSIPDRSSNARAGWKAHSS